MRSLNSTARADRVRPGSPVLLTIEAFEALQASAARMQVTVDTHLRARVDRSAVGEYGRREVDRELGQSQIALASVKRAIGYHEIVEPTTQRDVVDVGNIIVVQHYDGEGKQLGVPESIYIGPFGSSDSKTSPPTASYDSRKVIEAFGQKVGFEFTSVYAGKPTFAELIEIRLPGDTPVHGATDQDTDSCTAAA